MTAPLTDLQRRTIWAITSIFETGCPAGDYSSCGDRGDGAGLTYGAHQGTDRSGTLDEIVWRYIRERGDWAASLTSFMDELKRDETERYKDAPWVRQLRELLVKAGADPTMRDVQDQVFADRYWVPAMRYGQGLGLELPLSYAALYDLAIHSRDPDEPMTEFRRADQLRQTFDGLPPSRGGDERSWTMQLTAARDRWLRTSATKPVRASAYRTIALMALMDAGAWDLRLPLTVRGTTITKEDLA